jgi:hypothetical protein
MNLTNTTSKFAMLITIGSLTGSLALASVGSDHAHTVPQPAVATNSPAASDSSLVPVADSEGQEPANAKVLPLTIRPTGFQPAEVSIPAGKYLVVVRNNTGLEQFAIRVERGGGVKLYDVRLPRHRREWRQFVQLPPDTYVITEGNHPEWVCRITVTAN